MKAAVLKAKNDIECLEVRTPEPRRGELRVKVACTGVCGSDVPRVLQGRVHGFPLILGHEFCGTVDMLGEGVDEGLLGRRVVGVPLVPCIRDDCPECAAGDFSLCKDYSFIGSRQPGSMAEYVCLPARNAFPIDEGVSDLQGALFEPATVAIHGIELACPARGKSAIVLGCGTIGILLAQALAHYGIDNVVVAIHRAAAAAPVLSVGLDAYVATEEEGWRDKARALAGVSDFDYVFDTAGTPHTIPAAFSVAAGRGTVCFVGTPRGDVVFSSSQWEQVNRRELSVTGSWMSYSAPWPGSEWETARHLFSTDRVKVSDEMVDHVYNLADVREAFRRFDRGDVRGKIVIES